VLTRLAAILAFVCSLLAPNVAAAQQATAVADTAPAAIVPTVNAARAGIVPARIRNGIASRSRSTVAWESRRRAHEKRSG